MRAARHDDAAFRRPARDVAPGSIGWAVESQDERVERRRRGSLSGVARDVEVAPIRPPVGQPRSPRRAGARCPLSCPDRLTAAHDGPIGSLRDSLRKDDQGLPGRRAEARRRQLRAVGRVGAARGPRAGHRRPGRRIDREGVTRVARRAAAVPATRRPQDRDRPARRSKDSRLAGTAAGSEAGGRDRATAAAPAAASVGTGFPFAGAEPARPESATAARREPGPGAAQSGCPSPPKRA